MKEEFLQKSLPGCKEFNKDGLRSINNRVKIFRGQINHSSKSQRKNSKKTKDSLHFFSFEFSAFYETTSQTKSWLDRD
jgi:hypothetical protein